jgi:hypothetical protein
MPQIGLLVSLAEARNRTLASPPSDGLVVANVADSAPKLTTHLPSQAGSWTSALFAFWNG